MFGSERYFKLYKDTSVVLDRQQHLQAARKLFADRVSQYCDTSVVVPSITYVIPFRDTGRNKCILTVVNNIRAQKFPYINIILVEQDSKTKIPVGDYEPIEYYLADETRDKEPYTLFNKSKAFNLGVSKAKADRLILHDADILVQGNYTQHIYDILNNYDSCHVGKTVIYATKENTDKINITCEIDSHCERVVGYFEGGSIACTTKAYWNVGGFNEDFWGYGVEDCEFYNRLSLNSKWYEQRTFDFLHLWHGRVSGWNNHHNINKELGNRIIQMPMSDRILRQKQQLRNNGYADYVLS